MKPILIAMPLLVAPLLSVAVPAMAAPETVVAETPDGKTEKLVCKRVQITGSRIGASRVCRTQAEWDSDAEQASDSTRRMQNSRESTHGS